MIPYTLSELRNAAERAPLYEGQLMTWAADEITTLRSEYARIKDYDYMMRELVKAVAHIKDLSQQLEASRNETDGQ